MTSTLDKPVRDATDNRVVAWVLDQPEYAGLHPASSMYDLTVRDLLADYRERRRLTA